MSSAAGRESDKFQLRLPDGMRDRIKAAAQANGRSMNAEVVATLEEKYPAPPTAIPFADLIRAILSMSHEERAGIARKAGAYYFTNDSAEKPVEFDQVVRGMVNAAEYLEKRLGRGLSYDEIEAISFGFENSELGTGLKPDDDDGRHEQPADPGTSDAS